MNKRIFSLLRFVLILATILVMTYSKKGLCFGEPGYIIALIYFLSNLIISRLPDKLISKPGASFAIFLFDIFIISAAVYLSGGIETDFYLIYFLAIFIASVGQSTGGSVPIAIIASIMYAWLMYRANPGISLLDSRFLIRIPFLFIISLVSSYWSESMRRELKNREELERFNRELKKEVDRIAAKEIEQRIYNEKLINSVASGIIALKKDGLVTTVNPEAERVFGIKKDDLLGYNIKSIEGIDPLWEKIVETIKTGKPLIRGEVEILNSAKDEIPIGFNITPVTDVSGEVSGCVLIFKDLSEVRKLEAQLKHTERLSYLGKMASWVAHEIRNPLTSIDGFAQLLTTVKDREKMEVYIAEIRRGAARINHIISDILTFARAKKIEFLKIELRQLLESIIREVRVKVILDCPSQLLIRGEEESIRRVFVNLINNGVEAMDENGILKIHCHSENSFVITEVIDNGEGISEKNLQNLFTPFFTTKQRGTGLGLAIVKKIVDEHNGKIEVKSQIGKGTTCVVYLPKYVEEINRETL